MESTGQAGPIDASLWHRLKALDHQCHISFWRENQWLCDGARGRKVWMGIEEPNAPRRRAWRVRIFVPVKAGYTHYVDTAAPLIADALLAAIEQAEANGWHHPT